MSTALIIEFVKKLIPKTRVGSWILGLIAAALAMFLGVQNDDLKSQFCSSATVELPKVEAPVTPAK